MKLTSKTTRVAVGILAVALPLSMAACTKGGSSSTSGAAGGELTMWTHNAGNKGELAALYCFVYLYLSAVGGGSWSLDRLIFKRGPE